MGGGGGGGGGEAVQPKSNLIFIILPNADLRFLECTHKRPKQLKTPQMIKYGGCMTGGYSSCYGNEACLCKRCTNHWEK